MKKLLESIEILKGSDVGTLVNTRTKEINKESSNEIFKEICFFILTANFDGSRADRE